MDYELRKKFSEKQWKALEYIEMGLSSYQAAKKAGYKDPKHAAYELRKNETFMAEADRRLQRNAKKMEMTRDKVQAMIMEAFEIAKMTTDANAMVRACSEINKMCGFYEAEKAQIDLNKQQAALYDRLNELSDEELMMMASAAGKIDPAAEAEAEAQSTLEYFEGEFTEEDTDDGREET